MRCINCGIGVQRLQRRLISSLSAHHQTKLSRWLTSSNPACGELLGCGDPTDLTESPISVTEKWFKPFDIMTSMDGCQTLPRDCKFRRELSTRVGVIVGSCHAHSGVSLAVARALGRSVPYNMVELGGAGVRVMFVNGRRLLGLVNSRLSKVAVPEGASGISEGCRVVFHRDQYWDRFCELSSGVSVACYDDDSQRAIGIGLHETIKGGQRSGNTG
ncbi:unnamed protein product [Spodoptera exigua]|nr:unnamed protein product [Spodoptera exigua]